MTVDTAAMRTVLLDERPLEVAELVAIAHGARIELGPTARARMEASRGVVETLAGGEQLIYGLNTGLGHDRNTRLSPEAIGEGQGVIVRLHAGGIGEPLPEPIVRAAMAVRVAGFALGGSGVTPSIADTYVAMLNRGVHPVVPRIGSVGASDLMHMAAIALVAIGEGEAELDGARLPGGEALRRAAIGPVSLGPKDGLTVISANGVAIGHAALVVDRAERLADVADVVVALSLEAIAGNPSIVEPVVAAAKPVPQQAHVAARIRAVLDGSALCTGEGVSVQDPLSFRVAPQVHGAFRAVISEARRAVEQELAAMDDNPLVVADEDRMVSNGNFHPMLMALEVDALRPALAHVGMLSDRRSGQLWDRLVADPALMTPDGAAAVGRYGNLLLRYAGAAQAAALKGAAAPATLDLMPLDLGVEDHGTMAPLAAQRSDEALDLALDVLAVELLTASASAGWRSEIRERMGPRTRAIVEEIAAGLARLGEGASSPSVHAFARDLLRRGFEPGHEGSSDARSNDPPS